MGPEISGDEVYVSKLTTKTLGCKPDMVKTLPDGQNKLAIARLYGKAAEVKYQEDKNNPGTIHTFFAGNFEGINMQTGESVRSGKLFLPKGISEVVEKAIKDAKAKDPKADIAFAFEIRAVKATNPIGYSYEAVALRSPEAEDQLKEMREAIAKMPTKDAVKALPATGGGPRTIEGTAKKSA